MEIRRREFLKAGAAATAAAAAGLPALNAFAKAEDRGPMGEDPGKWVASTCQGCTAWCPIQIFVQDGRAVKVRGNERSKANNGYCCVRGHLILQQIYDPDRIKVPMKRTNPKKGRGVDPKFVPISWDEAMDTVAEKVMELRRSGETHKLMVTRGRYTDHNAILYGSVPKILGSPNNISHSAICAEVEKMGRFYTEGFWGYLDYDLEHTDYLVTWACDPLSSNRQVPNTIHKMHRLLERGTVVAIDPRMSITAAKAHEWLPVKPGEDGALACAFAHVLLAEGLWNREFVGDFADGANRFKAGQAVDEAAFREVHTNGLVKWWNLALKDCTPEWAAQVTGVSREQILRVARGMGKFAPRVAIWYGPNMQPRGTYSALAMHALNGLLGATDNEGGVFTQPSVPSTSYPKFDDYLDDVAKTGNKQKKIDQRGYKDIPAMASGKPGSGVVTNQVATAILAKDPYDIKVHIGYYNNFNFSCTGADRWDEAMAQVPFFVHIVPMASEMTQFADIVLPSALHHSEQWGISRNKANGYAHMSIHQPAIERMWDVKDPECEVVWLLGEKLKARGFSNLYDWLHKEFKDPETGKNPANALELALFATKLRSKAVWAPDPEKPPKGDKLAGWEDFREKGLYNSEPFAFKKKWGNFPTETKKFELYSETLKKALTEHAEKHKTTVDDILAVCNYTARGELAFVPHYEPVLRHGSEQDYPFALIDYKSRLNREGRSANLTWYHAFKKVDPGNVNYQDVLQMNPADAERLGLREGDTVKVTSVVKSLTARVRLWEGVRPGTVAKCFGQGHWAYGRVAAGDYAKAVPNGSNFNELMPHDLDRLSGSTARNGGFTGVRIEKV
ncbi:MAG: molybdopterin-dependent oxidoreductase [Thermodesulfobacteriota bacterium]|jgi:anaerobic selenocysteine-containing dehydrogenase